MLREEIDAHLQGNYSTYDVVARCLSSSLRWRNCAKIDMEILLDHDERFF
jgi:hypothetical protein